MSVRHIAGIVAGTEISNEDAEAINYDGVIFDDAPNGSIIFGKWLYKVSDYEGRICFPTDDILLHKSDADEIYNLWQEHFPDRTLPKIKKFFVYFIDY